LGNNEGVLLFQPFSFLKFMRILMVNRPAAIGSGLVH